MSPHCKFDYAMQWADREKGGSLHASAKPCLIRDNKRNSLSGILEMNYSGFIIRKHEYSNMKSLDVDLLRVFVAIAETKNFTDAGQRLCRTQSTVSLQLQRLEKQLDCRLLHRAQGHVDCLTPAGTTLLEYAHEMIRTNNRVVAALNDRRLEGKVSLGLADEAAHQDFSEALAQFQAHHPLVHLEVTCASSGELEEWVHAKRVDLALVNRCGGEQPHGLYSRRLFEEALTWVMHESNRWHNDGPIPLVSFPQGCAYRTRAIQALETKGMSWHSVYTSASHQGVWSAVSSGLGIAALPLRGLATRQPGIVVGRATGLGDLVPVEVTLLSRDNNERNELQRSLCLCIQQQFVVR